MKALFYCSGLLKPAVVENGGITGQNMKNWTISAKCEQNEGENSNARRVRC